MTQITQAERMQTAVLEFCSRYTLTMMRNNLCVSRVLTEHTVSRFASNLITPLFQTKNPLVAGGIYFRHMRKVTSCTSANELYRSKRAAMQDEHRTHITAHPSKSVGCDMRDLRAFETLVETLTAHCVMGSVIQHARSDNAVPETALLNELSESSGELVLHFRETLRSEVIAFSTAKKNPKWSYGDYLTLLSIPLHQKRGEYAALTLFSTQASQTKKKSNSTLDLLKSSGDTYIKEVVRNFVLD